MAGSEPLPEKDEPPAISKQANCPTRGGKKEEGENGTEAGTSGYATGREHSDERDEFGLPKKEIRRRSTSTIGYETASEAESHGPEKNDSAQEAEEQSRRYQEQTHDLAQNSPLSTSKESKSLENRPKVNNAAASGNNHSFAESHLPENTDEASLPATDDILHGNTGAVSGWSHQALASKKAEIEDKKEGEEWQSMPAYAPYDLYDDDGHLIAREAPESDEEDNAYHGLGGAGKGYTRVQVDEDAKSATSMDDNTEYLFKSKGTDLHHMDDEEQRDPLAQLQATKGLLTEGQRIAYVGITRLRMAEMVKELEEMKHAKKTKKVLGIATESTKMWSQKIMVRMYKHMEIDSSEQVMIEQLSEHGVLPSDLTPALMQNARVKNPMAEDVAGDGSSLRSPKLNCDGRPSTDSSILSAGETNETDSPPPYKAEDNEPLPEVRTPSQLGTSKSIDIDLRWTVLCDLFLVLLSDSMYDSRSRTLLEHVGKSLEVPWLDICRFEKRVTDSLEMQDAAEKETWDEAEHMESRRKRALKRRYIMMGLATVGGSLVIGLSAGVLAPVIGAGLAAGFSTIGVAGTSGFLAGAGGTALITSGAVAAGGTMGIRASNRRTGAVRTFEYRPLHNNKRVNLIVTISGWMNGKVDDVRLPFSTVDPVMGDIYSLLWEPEMLQSMGQTIKVLATEALTQSIQQVLGSTILVALMASLQLPIVLSKLTYLIDNPWTVSMGRANAAGLILADSLIDRNLGLRPITLVGFSLGARVIFAALRELASRGAYGLVQNVYLFGSPIVANQDEYLRVRSVISGRFVNGYASNDWILGYLFRATAGGIMRVAGLAKVENIPGLENMDCTKNVNGHMAYRAAMPKLLRELGWDVESDEFTEIEDPDPDNHEKRQRELIRELDEARKEAEAKPEKRRFGFFKRGKLAEKKGWETYDDRMRENGGDDFSTSAAEGQGANILFDIEAIKKELESEQIEVRQLESTLPPMKLNINGKSVTPGAENGKPNPYSTLRETKSYDGSMADRPKISDRNASNSSLRKSYSNPFNQGYDEYNLSDEAISADNAKLSFEAPRHAAQSSASLPQLSPRLPQELGQRSATPPRQRKSNLGSGCSTPPSQAGRDPGLPSALSSPGFAQSVEHNAWAGDQVEEEEDYFGQEKEVKMTF